MHKDNKVQERKRDLEIRSGSATKAYIHSSKQGASPLL